MVEACKMVGTPARLGGALRQMLMPKLPLFCKSKTAAEHPKALAERYAGLVIKTFKQNLQLEFWRYKLQTKEGEVSKLQRNWIRSKEARTPAPSSEEPSSSTSKRAWQVGDITKDMVPRSDMMSKKQRKEKENDFFLGGMRNPDIAVSKLHMVTSVGMDISRAWNRFIQDNPKALGISKTYMVAMRTVRRTWT